MTTPVSGFAPIIGQSQSLSVTSTSGILTFSGATVYPNTGLTGAYPVKVTSSVSASQIRVYNAGPNPAFIRWGIVAQGAVTASATTDMIIPVGNTETFNKGTGTDTFAAICSAAQTATLYVTAGEGGS